VLGTQPVSGGGSMLTLPLNTFTVGVRYSITATYSGSGDANSTFDPSAPSPPLTFTFHQYAPVIKIASTSNPAVYGGTVTFTATLTPSVPGAPIPTGTVSFLDNSFLYLSSNTGYALPLNAAGQASITVPYTIQLAAGGCVGLCDATTPHQVLSGGGHVMSVTYSGDANYVPLSNPNPAASLNQQIAKSDTITVLSSSQTGQIASLTATVSPASLSPVSFPWVCASNGCSDGRPSGSVQFWSDSTFIGTAMLTPSSATASSATVSVSAPPGSIRVVYYGDANYNGSNYPAQTPPASVPMSSVIITADPISPTIGQPVTFAVSVVTANGTGPANGTVQFFDGLKPLGTARVSSGTVLLTATLGLGSHTISATYSGDATYPAASQTMGIYVTRLSDSLSLTSNTSTTASGQSITFTARLAWQPVAGVANPSGKVQFFAGCLCGLFGSMINRTLVGTAALSDSVATVTIGNLPDSSPQVAAVYDGDDSWSGTKSNPLTPARK